MCGVMGIDTVKRATRFAGEYSVRYWSMRPEEAWRMSDDGKVVKLLVRELRVEIVSIWMKINEIGWNESISVKASRRTLMNEPVEERE